MVTLSSIVDISSLLESWNRLSRIPGGKRLFSRAVGMMAPYTGSIDAVVEDVRPGFSRVALRDQRKVRNHLRSIHAVALVNLAELAANLALLAGLPPEGRMIVKGISIEYLKKARGTITATGQAPIVTSAEKQEVEPMAQIVDATGEIVAKARLKCVVGPKP